MLWKKNKEPDNDKFQKEIVGLLEITRVQLVELSTRMDNLQAKLRGMDIKYGKLLKSIQEEDLNTSETSKNDGNTFNRGFGY